MFDAVCRLAIVNVSLPDRDNLTQDYDIIRGNIMGTRHLLSTTHLMSSEQTAAVMRKLI